MNKPPAERSKPSKIRTLQSMKKDYDAFIKDGGNVKDAKLYNNVINEPMFNVEIEQVYSILITIPEKYNLSGLDGLFCAELLLIIYH